MFGLTGTHLSGGSGTSRNPRVLTMQEDWALAVVLIRVLWWSRGHQWWSWCVVAITQTRKSGVRHLGDQVSSFSHQNTPFLAFWRHSWSHRGQGQFPSVRHCCQSCRPVSFWLPLPRKFTWCIGLELELCSFLTRVGKPSVNPTSTCAPKKS